jgi:aspartate ammonia-lyase
MGLVAAVARIDCMNYRTEHDLIGECSLPADVLWGVHTHRAVENFAHLPNRPVHRAMIHAFGSVKLACATTNHELGYLTDEQYSALAGACEAMVRGELDEHIVVSAWQGGAGTSTNMNVNEVLANVALKAMGKAPGDYDALHPLDHVNLHQSTNDTYPTAIRVAAMRMLVGLERAAVSLQEAFQAKEAEFAHVVKIGRTQLQDAVLTTLGREMGAYGEALSRDRWRIFKCNERLRVVNLGGTAIGTGIGAPRQYIFQATDCLRTQTGLNIARVTPNIKISREATLKTK